MRIVEVGPRDGLQNERVAVSRADKVRLVDGLSECGLSVIEVGSFVSPRWVPAMADSFEVFRAIRRRNGVSYAALTPNVTGLDRAIEADASEVAVFASASESFSRANINCSVEESLQRFGPVLDKAKQRGVKVRGYVSCVIGWSNRITQHKTTQHNTTSYNTHTPDKTSRAFEQPVNVLSVGREQVTATNSHILTACCCVPVVRLKSLRGE